MTNTTKCKECDEHYAIQHKYEFRRLMDICIHVHVVDVHALSAKHTVASVNVFTNNCGLLL